MLHKNKHFIEAMIKALEISKIWGIAISGGADSLGLFVAINDFLLKTSQKVTLNLLIVDHNLRTESIREIEFIENLANFYHYKLLKLSWKHNNSFKNNLYDAARKARYEMLIHSCRDNNIKVLFTAHHFDDQVETFKMRLKKGSGVSGLTCINSHLKYQNINIMRPFLKIKHHDIKCYLSKKNFLWVEDRANYNQQCARAKMRKFQKDTEFSEDRSSNDNVLLGENINLIVSKMSLASEALDFYTEIEFNRIVCIDQINLCISVNAESFFQIPKKISIKILKKILITCFFFKEKRVLFQELLNLHENMRKNLFAENYTLQFSNLEIECGKNCFLFKKQ
jgi:tRNA(Ile)-lysidine synthase